MTAGEIWLVLIVYHHIICIAENITKETPLRLVALESITSKLTTLLLALQEEGSFQSHTIEHVMTLSLCQAVYQIICRTINNMT